MSPFGQTRLKEGFNSTDAWVATCYYYYYFGSIIIDIDISPFLSVHNTTSLVVSSRNGRLKYSSQKTGKRTQQKDIYAAARIQAQPFSSSIQRPTKGSTKKSQNETLHSRHRHRDYSINLHHPLQRLASPRLNAIPLNNNLKRNLLRPTHQQQKLALHHW